MAVTSMTPDLAARQAIGASMLIAVLLGVAGCGSEPEPGRTPTSTTAAPVLKVDLPSVGSPDVYLQARFEAELRATEEGCLYALARVAEGAPSPVALFWPDGWTALSVSDGEFVVLDEVGNRRLTTGETFSVSGGNTFQDSPALCLDEPMGQFSMHGEPRQAGGDR